MKLHTANRMECPRPDTPSVRWHPAPHQTAVAGPQRVQMRRPRSLRPPVLAAAGRIQQRDPRLARQGKRGIGASGADGARGGARSHVFHGRGGRLLKPRGEEAPQGQLGAAECPVRLPKRDGREAIKVPAVSRKRTTARREGLLSKTGERGEIGKAVRQ